MKTRKDYSPSQKGIELYIYLVSQDVNEGYETYDSFVVVAKNEEAARRTHPDGRSLWDEEKKNWYRLYQQTGGRYYKDPEYSEWTNRLGEVRVEKIGTADKDQVEGCIICASFNAG